MKIKHLFSIAALFFLVSSVQAQKFGHLNSGNLLEKIPEVKAADEKLKTFQEGLMSQGQTMVQSFEKKYQAYATEAQGGTLSRIE
ncbi:MAG: OmpH family outer membrane protein, partial [Bacteroidota bacterium]